MVIMQNKSIEVISISILLLTNSILSIWYHYQTLLGHPLETNVSIDELLNAEESDDEDPEDSEYEQDIKEFEAQDEDAEIEWSEISL